MRKLIVVTLLISTLSFPCLSEPLTIDDLVRRNDLWYKKFTDEPYTGKITGKENGKLTKGVKDSLWLSYHSNGQLFSKGTYVLGERIGTFEFYWKSGKLSGRYKYDKGREVYIELYYENGVLTEKYNRRDGKYHGPYEYFAENGYPKIRGNFRNGERHGSWEHFSDKGNLQKKIVYNADTGIDEYEDYYENGQLFRKVQKIDDKQSGVWKRYTKDGNLVSKGSWEKGEKQGVWEYYSNSGTETYVYKNGVKQ